MTAPKILAFYNKETIPLNELKIPIEDRAFFFGDAVYEVLRVYQKKPFLINEHLQRLSASLDAIGLSAKVGNLRDDILENIAINQIEEGMVYLQISRGCAPRNHSFHNLVMGPNILIYAKAFLEHPCAAEASAGIKAITHEDWRWSQCHIKSVNLLPNCLIQTKAQEMGCGEALLIRNDFLTEGTSSNVFVVKNSVIYTPPLSDFILPGTRRKFLIEHLGKKGHPVKEQPINKEELFLAEEIFITSSIKEAVPIIELDGRKIGNGMAKTYAKLARQIIVEAAYN